MKNLTPNFGPHLDITALQGRLACLQTSAARDVVSRSGDLHDLVADLKLSVVWARLARRGGPQTAPVQAWRGAVRAPDMDELLAIATGGRQ